MAAALRKKLVLVGDGKCGKTCLLFRFSRAGMPKPGTFVPAVFDTTVTNVPIDGVDIQLALWDTAGDDDYDRLRPLSYQDTDVVVICYSVDAPKSYQNVLQRWLPEAQNFCPSAPIILVATKRDLRYDPETVKSLRRLQQGPVTEDEGRRLAKQISASDFVECSAVKDQGIAEIFEAAAKAALKSCTVPARATNGCMSSRHNAPSKPTTPPPK